MKRILVIDDDLIIGRLIEKLSQRNGAAVTIVRNGEEAGRVLKDETRFDLIFLDLIIPDVSGWDLLTAIKINPATRDVPVVILTGCCLSEEEIKRLKLCVKMVIDKKMFESEQIEDMVKSIA